MSTATQTPVNEKRVSAAALLDDGVEHCVLEGVRWNTYKSLLKDVGERHLFFTYDSGTLEIMAPSGRHEHDKAFISRLLDVYALEMEIRTVCFGSVTIQRKDLLKGLEPDCCYYVKRELEMSAKRDLDFSVDPAPDLVIEIERSRRISKREAICAALGVPELWLDDGKSLRVLQLKYGVYEKCDRSLNFPKLPIKEFERFLRQASTKRQYDILREFQSWVRKQSKKK